jgi:hypothetical protein
MIIIQLALYKYEFLNIPSWILSDIQHVSVAKSVRNINKTQEFDSEGLTEEPLRQSLTEIMPHRQGICYC